VNADLSSVRVLHGRHGVWVDDGIQAVLVSEADIDPASAGLLEALAVQGMPAGNADVYAVTVVTTTRCNLTCDYCFQAEASSQGVTRIPQETLTVGRVEDVTRFVAQQMAQHGKSSVDLLITGGEPLLSYSRCCDLLAGFGSLGLSGAQMFTNGALLSCARAQELHELGLSSVQVSLDGHRAEHDRYRRDAAGRGSYDEILANLQEAVRVAPGLDIVVRINVSASNAVSINDLVDELEHRLGPAALELRFGLLDDIGVGFENAPNRTDATMAILTEAMLDAVDRGFFVAPLAAVAGCMYCSIPGGGSGCVINADGTLYSCWESVGRSGYAVGTVDDGYVDASAMAGRWVDCSFNVVSQGSSVEWLHAANDRIDAQVLDRMYERSIAVKAGA